MTTIVKSLNDTSVSILNSVGTIANTATQSIEAMAKGLDMLDMFVTTAHTKQKARTLVDMSSFYDQLVEDTAIENAERQHSIIEKLNQNPVLKNLFTTESNKLTDLLKSSLNPTP